MKCVYHSERDVVGVCSLCGRASCEECAVDLSGQPYCKGCLEDRVSKSVRQVRGVWRFLLSIVPGLGHLYMGMMQRGIQLMVGAFFGTALLGELFSGSGLPPLFYLGMVFFSIFDAREIHLRKEQGSAVEDKGIVDMQGMRLHWSPRYTGYGLIGIGLLSLYNILIHDVFRIMFSNIIYFRIAEIANGVLLGMIFLGGGVWMLRKT